MERSTFSRYVNDDGDAQIAGKRALYNNLSHSEELALKIDETVRKTRPDGWRGHQAKENTIKTAILPLWEMTWSRCSVFSHHQSADGILMVPQFNLGDIAVKVVFKDIKHVHLTVRLRQAG
jgi:hypothetical protein